MTQCNTNGRWVTRMPRFACITTLAIAFTVTLAHAASAQLGHRPRDGRPVRWHVEAAFRGELTFALGDQRDLVRSDAQRDARHLRRWCHLDVELRRHDLAQQLDVTVVDVPTIAPQMHGNAVGARQLAHERSRDRLRLARAPGLTNGGDVVDVDSEAHGQCWLQAPGSGLQADSSLQPPASSQSSAQMLFHFVGYLPRPRADLRLVRTFEHDTQQRLGA